MLAEHSGCGGLGNLTSLPSEIVLVEEMSEGYKHAAYGPPISLNRIPQLKLRFWLIPL